MTLHEAMQIVLEECPNKSATTDFISKEIAKRNLYRAKNWRDRTSSSDFFTSQKISPVIRAD